jgi:hypothetical protein
VGIAGFGAQPTINLKECHMGKTAINDLVDQYRRAFHMLYEEIERFDEQQWRRGLDSFQVPVKLAMHITDALDYYFSGKSGDQYRWGHHFGGGWWELADDQMPNKATVLAYTKEVEGRIINELSSLNDADLSKPFAIHDGSGATLLGHYVYALRHTMHHHGELAALAVHHGREGGSWA